MTNVTRLPPRKPPADPQATFDALLEISFAQNEEIIRLREEYDRLKAAAGAIADRADEQTASVEKLAKDLARIPTPRSGFLNGFVLGCVVATVIAWAFL